MKTSISIAALAILLAGCSDTSNEPANAPTAQPAADKNASTQKLAFEKGAPVSAADFTADGVQLTVTPNPYSACDFPKGQAVVNIGFDARPAGIKHVQIWVQRSNGAQVLWGQAPGFSPAHPTGNWMSEGAKLLLVNIDTGQLIAVSTIHAAACK